MQNEEASETKAVDYDDLIHNAAQNDGGENEGFETETVKKDKTRRYWTAKEEERFFEIWGRENWRLTRHGKNTVFFAQWSKELKERYDMDIKPEEVQAKVNQTRAKFRSVKKSMETDFIQTKWKKYDMVDRILKNQFRTDTDDPIPREALENNRDFSPNSSRQVVTPNSITSNSTQDTLNHSTGGFTAINNTPHMSNDEVVNKVVNEHDISTSSLYPDATQNNHSYSTDMYAEQYPQEVKQEYEEEFQSYSNYADPMQYPNTAEPHLHQLQTPQQHSQQQQQHVQQMPQHNQHPQQNQQHSMYPTAPPHQVPPNMMHPQHHMPPHNMNQMGQDVGHPNNQDHSQTQYEPVSNPTYTNLNEQTNYSNGTYNPNNYNTTPAAVPPPVPPPMPHLPNATAPGNGNSMQPPRPTPCSTPVPRKRGRPLGVTTGSGSNSTAATGTTTTASPSMDALESQYMDQVRKKNSILEEQRDISRKRLEVEERKISLMEEFFPKLLGLQQEILGKMASNPAPISIPAPITFNNINHEPPQPIENVIKPMLNNVDSLPNETTTTLENNINNEREQPNDQNNASQPINASCNDDVEMDSTENLENASNNNNNPSTNNNNIEHENNNT